MLDGPAMRAEVASPTYRGGVWDRTGSGIVDPGKLAAGLRDAAIRAGVRVYEHSAVHEIGDRRPDRRRARPRPQGPARHQRLPAAGPRDPPLRRARLRLRADDRAGRPVGDRLAAPPGHRRRRQPVPLLPAHRRQPHPVRRLGRRLPLPRPGRPPPRRPRADVRDARPALLPHVPAARGHALHPPLGRRDRHLVAVLGLLRHRARRPARLRDGLHRARRRRGAVRRPDRARPPRRPRRPRRPGCATCAPSRSRSRRSRCAGP